MKHTLRLLFTIALLFSASAAFAACEGRLPSSAQRAINPNSPNLETFSASVRYYANIQRCKLRLTPFTADAGLLNAATVHSTYMASAQNLTHNSNVRGYRNLKERMRSSNVSMRTAGENIGQNFLYVLGGKRISLASRGRCQFTYSDTGAVVPQHSYASLASELVLSWMASPDHRHNLTNRRFTRMEASFGFRADKSTCGYIYASQNFAG
ncbi:hypothetical protein A9Q96_08790 [Rhodobacterales bacterium 52_120_T64]|nr:hypothetical protein A9Q96_08790 [Rhodobacterales bacterium 52_120_T64]